MRSGSRATYFKYELDQVDDGVSYSFAGPAFGIRGYDNLFFLHYYPSPGRIVLGEENGGVPFRATAWLHSVTRSEPARLTVA